MAHAISLPVPSFEDRYWLHREAYDLGQSDRSTGRLWPLDPLLPAS